MLLLLLKAIYLSVGDTLCTKSLLQMVLASYEPSFSPVARLTWAVMAEFTKRGIGLDHVAWRWGTAARRQLEIDAAGGDSTMGDEEDSVYDWLLEREGLSAIKLSRSALMLPFMLLHSDDGSIISKDARATVKDVNVYPPHILLKLFCDVMPTLNSAQLRRIIDWGALQHIVASLASIDVTVRTRAYDAIGIAFQCLQAASFREQRQILQLCTALKACIEMCVHVSKGVTPPREGAQSPREGAQSTLIATERLNCC